MVRQLNDDYVNAARLEVREWMKSRPDVTSAHIAQFTTLSDSTVRAWIAGAFPGGHDVVQGILSAVRQAKAGDILRPGGHESVLLTVDEEKRVRRVQRADSKFYETQTVKRISEVLDYCAERCAIGVVTADFGVGKTEAVKAWRQRNAGKVESVVFEFDEFSSTNKVDFVRLMARQFGIASNVGPQNGGLVFRDLCEYLRQDPTLLIFDQCETVRPRVCQVIRQLWDRTADAGVGVVMLAAPILLARLMSGKMADLGALTSRVGIWAPLSGMTRGEMAAIIKQEGIADIDEAAFDLWWRGTGGSMRRLMRAIDLLKTKHSGKRVTEKTIVGVAAHLWGMGNGQAA
jgi:DNA transposition AAA+ family ATPase